LIPGSTAPTGDSPVIQALKKRNVIDDGGDSDLPPSWTPPPTGRTRGLSGLIDEEVVKPVKNIITDPFGTIERSFKEDVIDPIERAYTGFTTDPIEYVKETAAENPFSTLGFIVSNIMKFSGVGTLPAFAVSIVGNILDLLTGSDKEYMQGIQHGLFSPDAPAQGVGSPGDRSMMGVYGTNPVTGEYEYLGTELELGQRRAVGLTDIGTTPAYSPPTARQRAQMPVAGAYPDEIDLNRGIIPSHKLLGKVQAYYFGEGIDTTPKGPSPSQVSPPSAATTVSRADAVQRAEEFAISPTPSPSQVTRDTWDSTPPDDDIWTSGDGDPGDTTTSSDMTAEEYGESFAF